MLLFVCMCCVGARGRPAAPRSVRRGSLLTCTLPPHPTPPQNDTNRALAQCGPRFELRPYQIRLGTMDQQHAESEWVLRAYTRSAKRSKLGDEAAPAAAGG